ncbi:hypothetical protein AB0I28_32210 [Phytomonospora sp. NPDC050363]|uniref:type I-G CRISPR-associated protein, Cas3-extension family n=1 Tax=Phytomonospora sp. NPDC050363 TaxID=3155642 RepID=UPI0033FBB942
MTITSPAAPASAPNAPQPDGIVLPGLDGRSYAGFLASLGLLRLLTRRWPGSRLRFTTPWRSPVIADGPADLPALLAALGADLEACVERGSAGPELTATWPTKRDNLKLARRDYPAYRDHLAETGPAGVAWLEALISPAGVTARGECARSPLFALSGQQTIPTALAGPRDVLAADPSLLSAALLDRGGYADVPGGIYLDSAFIHSAADAGDGRPREQDRPGPLWLATQAIPLLRLYPGQGGRLLCATWHQIQGTTRLVAAWPLWTQQALTLSEVMLLVTDPRIAPRPVPDQANAPAGGYECAFQGADLDDLAAEYGPIGLEVTRRIPPHPLSGRKWAGQIAATGTFYRIGRANRRGRALPFEPGTHEVLAHLRLLRTARTAPTADAHNLQRQQVALAAYLSAQRDEGLADVSLSDLAENTGIAAGALHAAITDHKLRAGRPAMMALAAEPDQRTELRALADQLDPTELAAHAAAIGVTVPPGDGWTLAAHTRGTGPDTRDLGLYWVKAADPAEHPAPLNPPALDTDPITATTVRGDYDTTGLASTLGMNPAQVQRWALVAAAILPDNPTTRLPIPPPIDPAAPTRDWRWSRATVKAWRDKPRPNFTTT